MEGLETIGFTPPTTSCYNLVNCDTGAVDYVINSATNVILSEYVGQYVKEVTIDGIPFIGCWQIVAATSCENLRTEPIELNYFFSSSDDATYCGCPTNSTYDPITNTCVQTITQVPIESQTTLQTTAGNDDSAYSGYGTVFLPNISSFLLPIKAVNTPAPITYPPTLSGTNSIGVIIDSNNVPLIPVNIPANKSTSTPPICIAPLGPWDGCGTFSRLSDIGIWVPSDKNICDQWIGISECVNIPTTGVYSIGIAGDNKVRIKIDGQVVVEILESGYTYRTWNIFEITLTAGTRIIQLEGWNNSVGGVCSTSNPASFGAEIYSATIASLEAMTLESQVDAVTIFTTETYRTGGTFNVGTYTCPDGYALNTCGTPTCTLIQMVPFLPCCYNLVDCNTGNIDYQISYSSGQSLPGVLLPNQIISPAVISTIEFNDNTSLAGCWSLVKAQCDTPDYDWSQITNLTTLEDCITCSPNCYILEDCKGIQPILTVSLPNLDAYDGKVISFEIPTSPPSGSWPTGKYCASVSTTKNCISAIPIIMNNIVAYTTCELCSPPCYLLTDCSNPANTMVVQGDLSDCVGGVVTLSGCSNICWIVSLATDCDNAVPLPPVVSCLPPENSLPNKCCYTYGKPEDFDGTITINEVVYPIVIGSVDANDLVDAINSILFGITGGGICTILNQGAGGANTQICITGTASYGPLTYTGDAIGIATQNCIPIFKSCIFGTYDFDNINLSSTFIKITIDGTLHNITVTPPLTGPQDIVDYLNSLNLGQFSYTTSGTNFTIYVYGNYTYSNITVGTIIESSIIILDDCTDYANTSSNCQTCLPEPPAPTPFTLHTRKVKPGYDTKGCPPEYTEKVLCNFAEQAFDEMAKARYGIKICCEHDFDYWDIKKQILELKALYDEDVCHVQFPCTCYSLSNSNSSVSSIFNYSDCSGKYLTIEVTQADGVVKVCATNVPVGMGGTPTAIKGSLCQNEICS